MYNILAKQMRNGFGTQTAATAKKDLIVNRDKDNEIMTKQGSSI